MPQPVKAGGRSSWRRRRTSAATYHGACETRTYRLGARSPRAEWRPRAPGRAAPAVPPQARFDTALPDPLGAPRHGSRPGAGPALVHRRDVVASAWIGLRTCLRLLQPERHAHVAVHRRRRREMLVRGRPAVHAPMKPAEPEVAVRNERPHSAGLGERQCPLVGRLPARGIERVRIGRDLGAQVERVGQVAGPDRRAVKRVTAEPSRILRPAEEQVAAAEGVVHPYGVAGDLPRREVLRELLAFPESAQALVVFAELPQDPGAGRCRLRMSW